MRFRESKFGQFLTRIVGKIPELANDVADIAISPNPIGTGIQKILGRLKEKSENDERYREALLELEANRMEWEKEIFQIEVDDRKDARLTYRERNEMADRIARQVISWNLLMAMGLVVINILIPFFVTETSVVVLASNVIGILLGQVIRERGTVIDFFFGSSLGSKLKDKREGSE